MRNKTEDREEDFCLRALPAKCSANRATILGMSPDRFIEMSSMALTPMRRRPQLANRHVAYVSRSLPVRKKLSKLIICCEKGAISVTARSKVKTTTRIRDRRIPQCYRVHRFQSK